MLMKVLLIVAMVISFIKLLGQVEDGKLKDVVSNGTLVVALAWICRICF